MQWLKWFYLAMALVALTVCAVDGFGAVGVPRWLRVVCVGAWIVAFDAFGRHHRRTSTAPTPPGAR